MSLKFDSRVIFLCLIILIKFIEWNIDQKNIWLMLLRVTLITLILDKLLFFCTFSSKSWVWILPEVWKGCQSLVRSALVPVAKWFVHLKKKWSHRIGFCWTRNHYCHNNTGIRPVSWQQHFILKCFSWNSW